MADAMNLDTGTAAGVADHGSADTSKVQVPGYVKGQLGADGEALLKELQGDPSLAAKLPKGIPELFKSWRTLQSESSSAVRVPAKDAPREAWDQYYKSIGRPEGPEGYSFKKPDNLPSGLPYNPDLEKWFAQQMFEAGIPKDTAQKIFAAWNARQVETFATNMKAREAHTQAAIKAADESLHAEFKDAYPAKMEAAKTAMAAFMTPDLMKSIEGAKTADGVLLANDPSFVKAWVSVGERMSPDKLVTGAGGAGAKELPPANAPKSPSGHAIVYPSMVNDPQWRIKAE